MNNLMKVYKEVSIDVLELGKRIKEAREADSRPLTTICDLIDMSRKNWYDIESESQSLPLETLRKIENVLGVDFGVSLD
jgi:predicted transcriptional regulator